MRYAANPVRWLVSLAALALACGGGRAQAEPVLTPVDARGIRQLPGVPPFFLDFLAINRSIEDRTVLQFEVRGLSGPAAPTSSLDLDVRDLDSGGPVGVIDVFTFLGTGTVTPAQFNAGTPLTRVETNQSGLVHVDVTAAVRAAVAAGEPFLGFRLATTTGDRYVLGPPLTPAGPTLTVGGVVVPEPATLALAGTAALLGLGYAWRRRAGRAPAGTLMRAGQ